MDVPTWITAVATVGLLIGAIITATFAIKAFGKQSEQLADQRKINEEQTRVLKLQATELGESIKERKRESTERSRAQANRVFVSAEPYREEGEPISVIAVSVRNTSQQPIYDLSLLWPDETGEWSDIGDPVSLRVLLPGEAHTWGTSTEPSIPIRRLLMDPHVIRAAITFRDAARVRWRLYSDGQLDEESVTE